MVERRWLRKLPKALKILKKRVSGPSIGPLQYLIFARSVPWRLCKLVRVSEAFGQIDKCDYLFLAEIEELGRNGLRLLVREGRRAGEPQDIHVAGHTIHDCTPIVVTAESTAFEIIWEHYVAYCVLNESFAFPPNSEEVYTGERFRVYSKSRFRQYISRSTFATDEYPGPMQHYEVCCEDHVINVISTGNPRIRRNSA